MEKNNLETNEAPIFGMNKIKGAYDNYIGKWVRIRTNFNNFTPVGILDRIYHNPLDRISHNTLFLQPSLGYELTDDEGIELRLEKRTPTRVSSEHIDEIEPLTKDYVKRLRTKLTKGYDTHQLSLF